MNFSGENNNNFKHGDSYARLYRIWRHTKNRCYNKNIKQYKDYGGRGITVCDEWTESYIIFRDWALSNDYKDNLQINRINNDGNYEPSNCNFVTRTVNMRNTRRIKLSLEKADEIRKLYNTGNYTQRDLGRKFGLNQRDIFNIIHNKIWRNS